MKKLFFLVPANNQAVKLPETWISNAVFEMIFLEFVNVKNTVKFKMLSSHYKLSSLLFGKI